MTTIKLDWPSRKLSPNARTHWAALAGAKRVYRNNCTWLAKAAILQQGQPLATIPLPVLVTFNPPDKRGRDTDNMLASVKAGLDGVADAIGIDDKHWVLTIARGEPVKGGRVVVQIGQP